MQIKLLSIDANTVHQQLIAETFNKQSFLTLAFTLAEAEPYLSKYGFDLILMDISFPDGDGLNFYANLRLKPKCQDTPVIFLTSCSEASSEVMGFSLGAEDYILKPIDPLRLRARIEAKLKQIQNRKHRELFLQKGNIKVSISQQRVVIIQDGQEKQVDLTPVEFKLISHFIQNEERVHTRTQLLETIWGNEAAEVFDRTVDMHISNLRKKIALSDFKIQAVHGSGYRFVQSR